MEKQKLLAQLYARETNSQALVEQTDDLLEHIPSPEYQSWQEGKRSLERADVADSHWIKTCTAGYITEVVFHSDGTLNEYRLFDRFETTGNWTIYEGVLHVEITKADNCYRFSVVGNKAVNIHSAIEYKNQELHSYLKLAQIK